MSKAISSNIKQALCNRGFLIGVFGVILALVFSSIQDAINAFRSTVPLQNGFYDSLIMRALTSDAITLALPILCALPFTTSFVDDIKSGFIKQYLPRTSRTAYIKGKLIACGLSGGLVLMLGILLAYGLSALIFTPMELALAEGETAQPYFAKLLTVAATLCFSGAFWSLAGFTFAALTQSKYMAYASPFILYYVLIILHERYFKDFYVLYPKEWLFPSDAWPLGGLGVIILLLILSAVMGFWFAIIAKRRLANV